jgi:hypothetical protein
VDPEENDMKKVLLLVLFGATCIATPALAQDQGPLTLRDVYVRALAQAAPPAPARPATAPAPAQSPRPAPAAVPATVAPLAPAPPQAPAPSAAPVPARAGQANYPNVRFDVTITDTGGAKPVTKTLSLTVGSFGNNASIRNVANVPNISGVTGPPQISIPLNVDVRGVTWVDNSNSVRAGVRPELRCVGFSSVLPPSP